jgi:predicted O-linked N-acetylglucosamine transferase (SPINDLY family)
MQQIDIAQTLEIARRYHHAGQLRQAERMYRHVLEEHPHQPDALHLLGVLTAQFGRGNDALDLIRRAIAARPDWAKAYYDLGNIFARLGKLPDAIIAYRRAIEIEPDYVEALGNLGVVLKESGHIDEAITAFQKAIAIRPNNPAAFSNLGNALKEKGQLTQSIAAYRQALAMQPALAEVHNNLAVALKESGQLEESITACRQAIALRPNFAEAFSNLGVALEETGELDDAMMAYRQAIAHKPGYADAHYNLGNLLKATGQLNDSIAEYRRAISLKPTFVEPQSNLVYAMHFHPAFDARAIADELKHWSRQHAEPLKKLICPHSNDRNPDRRLRIGYVSPDFREHPVGRFLLPLLAHHDKSNFEIFAYSNSIRSDGLTEKLRSHTDTWRDITRLTDTQAADQIRNDKIDILIDLTMHMAHNRLRLFALKPAPVQITWLAYCSSTGLDAMDFRISDPHLDPPGMDDSIYSEQTIRLPETYWCYQPSIAPVEINSLPALDRNYITFGCLNNFAKVSELTLNTWIKLLHAVPNSRLLLHAPPGNHRKSLAEKLSRAGIASGRLHFAGKAPTPAYFRLYHQIDIALDTFPYGGGTTTCDALWMGVPVVTLTGKTAVGRGGASILSNLNLPELIAQDEAQYVQIAAKLANNLPRLIELRSTLRQRMEQSVLMDAPRFAKNMESAYRHAWSQWCSQRAQRH